VCNNEWVGDELEQNKSEELEQNKSEELEQNDVLLFLFLEI
jgi:hypothetical protein